MKKKRSLDDVSLTQLTELPIDHEANKRLIEQRRQAKEEYKKLYGKDWFKKWIEDDCPDLDYDLDMKIINGAIYHGGIVMVTGVSDLPERQVERMHKLFGDDCDFHYLYKFEYGKVAEVLIQEAIETGKWKELSDELQDEYHKRMDSKSGK